jgi:hypothetical protein
VSWLRRCYSGPTISEDDHLVDCNSIQVLATYAARPCFQEREIESLICGILRDTVASNPLWSLACSRPIMLLLGVPSEESTERHGNTQGMWHLERTPRIYDLIGNSRRLVLQHCVTSTDLHRFRLRLLPGIT